MSSTSSKNTTESPEPQYSDNAFLGWFERLIQVSNDALAITVLVFIFLGILLVLILIIVIVCLCKKMRNAAKKKRRPKMRGLYKDEVPGQGGSKVDVVGQLEYAIEYDQKKQELKVTVIQASDLEPPAGSSGCDPYVKLFLESREEADDDMSHAEASASPSRKKLSKVLKTSHKDDTHNPTWSESFQMKLAYEKIETAILKFEVFDYDTMGHDMKIGKVDVEMNELELVNFLNKRMEMSASLEKADTEYSGLGDLCVILRQSPSDDQLHVTILEAKKLSFDPEKFRNPPDVQVSVTLLVNKKRLGNKKTTWRHNTRNPYFSETMIFPIKVSKLSVASVSCNVKYKNLFGLTKSLGKIKLGSNSISLGGQKHWQEMLNQPRRAIAMWHGLTNPKMLAQEEE